ncbi:MAG: TIGR03757 family integrating conjugative element protein [Firmicutes bacterium]|nr:TIGR03757 family integrating conjugative element protein [Bacillota bacterium]
MQDHLTMPHGITIIYFDKPHKNIYAALPPSKGQARRLSRRIFKDAMTALSAEREKRDYLIAKLFPNNS